MEDGLGKLHLFSYESLFLAIGRNPSLRVLVISACFSESLAENKLTEQLATTAGREEKKINAPCWHSHTHAHTCTRWHTHTALA